MTDPETNTGPAVELEAQQVHTEVYLEEGFITPQDLNEEGLYVDEYTERSEPILVKLGGKETTVRLIHTDKKKGGLLSLPTAKHFSIDPAVVKRVAHATRLSDIRPKHVVELSGLASIPLTEGASRSEMFDATRQTYATALRHSLDQGHQLWLMNVDDKMMKYLDITLGEDSYEVIGDKQEYMGPPTTPIAMNPQDVVMSILTDQEGRFAEMNRADIAVTLDGVSEKYLSHTLLKHIKEAGIDTTPNSLLSKAWNNKKVAFYSVIVGYSALRFIPVGSVEQFDGSVPLYAVIDVGTALTQVGSMEVMFKAEKRGVRALGMLGTAASFVAPYAYFYANGNDYPPYVNAIAGGFVALSVALETDKSLRDNKLKKGLEQAPSESSKENPGLSAAETPGI